MRQLNPYIHFNGNALEAFELYRSVFGGQFLRVIRFSDMAGTPGMQIPEAEADKIMHIALPVGENFMLMGNDVPAVLGTVNENENRSKIYVNAETKAEADAFFAGLSAGGKVEMPMADSPWGSYFGMFRDRYGIEWMIDCMDTTPTQ